MKKEKKPLTERPYRFMVGGYQRIIKASSLQNAIRKAGLRWGKYAVLIGT